MLPPLCVLKVTKKDYAMAEALSVIIADYLQLLIGHEHWSMVS